MDAARDKRTLDPVEAEELWNMPVVDGDGYICEGCTVQVFPASYEKGKNRKRPYFTLGPVNEHVGDCYVKGEKMVIGRAKGERVGAPEGFPLPFPSKLTLAAECVVAPRGIEQPEEPAGFRTASRARPGDKPRGYHGHTVRTIRPACRAFIRFPHDRESLPFQIPGVPGDTYAKVFWYLGSKAPKRFKAPRHLYYAAIRWKADLVVEEACCEVTLNAGEWSEEKREYKTLSRVRIDWARWAEPLRNSFVREFEATRDEAAEEARKGSSTKGWVFFVGTQDSTDLGLFHIEDRRLICCLADEMVFPKWN
jgi:hypothetical protein